MAGCLVFVMFPKAAFRRPQKVSATTPTHVNARSALTQNSVAPAPIAKKFLKLLSLNRPGFDAVFLLAASPVVEPVL